MRPNLTHQPATVSFMAKCTKLHPERTGVHCRNPAVAGFEGKMCPMYTRFFWCTSPADKGADGAP